MGGEPSTEAQFNHVVVVERMSELTIHDDLLVVV